MEEKTIVEIKISQHKKVKDAYDRIVVKMHLQKQQKDCSVFLICGTDPKVGTTTSAVHLAAGLAKSGRTVLLLDADMRTTKGKRLFGAGMETGLADYLMDQVAMEDIISETNIDRLHVICGGNSSDPVQILCASKMRMLVNCVKEEYDFVIIDVPSVGAASDANAVLGYVDEVVLVAAPERTYKKQIIECYDTFKKYGANLLGVIVNRVDKYGYRDYAQNAEYYLEDTQNAGFFARIFNKKKKNSVKKEEVKEKEKLEEQTKSTEEKKKQAPKQEKENKKRQFEDGRKKKRNVEK